MNKPLILVVEDDSAVRHLITTTLETHNYRYHEAPSGEQAIMEAASNNPDVILLDLGLPDMDGMEFASLIRESNHPDAKTVPIILMSDNVVIEDMKRAYQMGINGSLSKPIDMHQLLQILQAVNGGLIK